MTPPGRAAVLLALGSATAGCVTYAAPPPLATMGGGGTAPRGASEVGLAVGPGASLFTGAHSGGMAWLGRWRLGVGEALDPGADLAGVSRGDKGTLTGKLAVRLRAADRLRLEVGAGGADDSDGKALAADTALVLDLAAPGGPLAPCLAVRLAGAIALGGDVPAPGERAPGDALFGLGTAGVAAPVAAGLWFVVEGAGGAIRTGGRAGAAVYVGVALLARIRTSAGAN